MFHFRLKRFLWLISVESASSAQAESLLLILEQAAGNIDLNVNANKKRVYVF